MQQESHRRLGIVHADGTISTLPLETTLREAAQEAAHLADLEDVATPPRVSWIEVRVGEPLDTDHLLVS